MRSALGIAGGALGMHCWRPAAEAAPALSGLDVKSFGASGDGRSLDTAAVNKAIDVAAAAGGGTVVFPAGHYLCCSIRLKSNVTLHLERGATIVAAEPSGAGRPGDGGSYDPAEPNQWDRYQDFGHSHFHNSLIWGEGLENIGITGGGRIWGKGLTRGPGAADPGVGNKSISLKNCRNVLLRDFSILHGGHFGILATGVDNFTLDNLQIDTNRDGMDIDCCRNVRVSNCCVNSPWDDGICLKADHALGVSRPTEFVTIVNCYLSGCWKEGTMLDGTWQPFGPEERVPRTGRIKFGTESDGGFRNIAISNCVFEGCQGLALESVDGALLEDVTVTNISMRDIVGAPIFLRLGRRMRAPEGRPVGTLRRVIISGLVCSNAESRLGSIVSGVPGHPIEDVTISNLRVLHRGGGTREDAAFQPPEYEDLYPEPTMFVMPPRSGNGRAPGGAFLPEGQARTGAPPSRQAQGRALAPPAAPQHGMPSHGFYVRHAKGIRFDNIDIRAEREDLLPAFVLDDVADAEFHRLQVSHASGVPVLSLHDVARLTVRMTGGVPDTVVEKAERKTL